VHERYRRDCSQKYQRYFGVILHVSHSQDTFAHFLCDEFCWNSVVREYVDVPNDLLVCELDFVSVIVFPDTAVFGSVLNVNRDLLPGSIIALDEQKDRDDS
jgi:hypothetical protein